MQDGHWNEPDDGVVVMSTSSQSTWTVTSYMRPPAFAMLTSASWTVAPVPDFAQPTLTEPSSPTVALYSHTLFVRVNFAIIASRHRCAVA